MPKENKELEQEKEPKKEPKTIKVWKTSITKAELAQLSAETFTGKINVITSQKEADKAAAILAAADFIGFDTETKPSFRRGERHLVALLQLSTQEESFLFRLNTLGLPQSISDILQDENKIKIGLSINDDFMSLKKRFEIEPRGFIDLQQYVKKFKIADNSLSRIYGILFGKRISKGQRLTNWEAPELTRHQQEYAALDALACLNIYNYLEEKGFDYRMSKYYREFDETTN